MLLYCYCKSILSVIKIQKNPLLEYLIQVKDVYNVLPPLFSVTLQLHSLQPELYISPESRIEAITGLPEVNYFLLIFYYTVSFTLLLSIQKGHMEESSMRCISLFNYINISQKYTYKQV